MCKKYFKIILAVLLLAVCGISYANQEIYEFVLEPGSRLWLEGDSTMHPFKAEAEVLKISGFVKRSKDMEFPEKKLREIVAEPELGKFILTIPVEQLSSETGGLAPRMHIALKGRAHPEIIFNLKSYEAKKYEPGEGDELLGREELYQVNASGTLLIAGVENTVNISSLAKVMDGHILITGEKDLLMTDFGIRPPRMLGFLRTHDEVTVKWELKLGAEEKKADAEENGEE